MLLKESLLSDRAGFFPFIPKVIAPHPSCLGSAVGLLLFSRLIFPDVLNWDQSSCSSPPGVLQQLPGIAGPVVNIADQPVADINHDPAATPHISVSWNEAKRMPPLKALRKLPPHSTSLCPNCLSSWVDRMMAAEISLSSVMIFFLPRHPMSRSSCSRSCWKWTSTDLNN